MRILRPSLSQPSLLYTQGNAPMIPRPPSMHGPTLQGSNALIHRDSYFLTSKKLEGKMKYKMQRSGTSEFLSVLEDNNEINQQNFGSIFSASNSVMNEDLQRQIQNYQKSNLKTVCDKRLHGADNIFLKKNSNFYKAKHSQKKIPMLCQFNSF